MTREEESVLKFLDNCSRALYVDIEVRYRIYMCIHIYI